jgi:serine/threonine-protein kinase RIO1
VIFQTNVIDGTTILSDANLDFNVNNDLFDPTWIRKNTLIKGQGLGRGQAIIFRHQDNNLVLRHYLRGGLVGRVNKDCFLRGTAMQSRAFKEMQLLANMQNNGLPVPRPVAARYQPSSIFYKTDILIEEIPNSQTLFDILLQRELTPMEWAKLGRVIASFHCNRIDHTDLNIRNILLDKDEKFWLIDFDKCRQRIHGRWRNNNLDRLERSFNKENESHALNGWTTQNWAKLRDAYDEKFLQTTL